MGARSAGEEQPQVSSPRARAKLKIGNELRSEGAKEIIIRWAGTEAGVQVYFYWSLSCGKCVAFPAFRHSSQAKPNVRLCKPNSACPFQLRNPRQRECQFPFIFKQISTSWKLLKWDLIVLGHHYITLGTPWKEKVPALIYFLKCHSKRVTAGGLSLKFRI